MPDPVYVQPAIPSDGITDLQTALRAALESDGAGGVRVKTGLSATVNVDEVDIADSAANTARTAASMVIVTQPVDAAGAVLGRTAANTARTTGTLVDPAQIVDAAGNVFNITAANTARTNTTLVFPVQIIDAAGQVMKTTSGGGVEAEALRVTIASDSTGVLSVDDNGGTLTVDGAVTATDVPPAALYSGTKTVADTGTPEAIAGTQALKRGVFVTGKTTNTANCFVGNASTQLTPLGPGQTIYVEIDDLAKVYIDIGVNGEGITYLAS